MCIHLLLDSMLLDGILQCSLLHKTCMLTLCECGIPLTVSQIRHSSSSINPPSSISLPRPVSRSMSILTAGSLSSLLAPPFPFWFPRSESIPPSRDSSIFRGATLACSPRSALISDQPFGLTNASLARFNGEKSFDSPDEQQSR
jgi:hypothetical protein